MMSQRSAIRLCAAIASSWSSRAETTVIVTLLLLAVACMPSSATPLPATSAAETAVVTEAAEATDAAAAVTTVEVSSAAAAPTSGSVPTGVRAAAANTSAPTRAQDPVVPTGDNAPAGLASVLMDDADRVLVWTADGAGPGAHNPAQPGSMVYLTNTGAFEPLLELPSGSARVTTCGLPSPDGRYAPLYFGGERGTLALVTDAAAPVALDEVDALTCVEGVRFSPDSARMAYIAYEPGAASDTFADGFLHVVNTANMADALYVESVTAFGIGSGGVAYVNFFTDDQSKADEAAVVFWDGSTEREVATLRPEEGCEFTSAQVALAPEGASASVILLMGQRCGGNTTSWQLYTVDTAARSAALVASNTQPAAFAAFARTNNLYFAPDGSAVYFTVPDGLTANTVAIAAARLADMTLSVPVERGAVYPTYSGATNATPVVSPDGAWLALATTTPNADNTLTVVDLRDPSVAPFTLSAGSRGDIISSLAFAPDSSRLYYVAGGSETANNSLFSLDLATGAETRVARGRFARGLTLSPDGTKAALLDWQVLEDPNEPAFANTVVISLADGAVTTVYEGAQVVDGQVEEQRFGLPLAWRRAG